MTDPEKISLKTFWDAVEQRLAACSGEELRNILRAMAQETPPSERRAFLNRLNSKEKTVEATEQAIGQEDLLADIDDVVQELESEMEDPHREYEWGAYDDEDSLGPYESFVEPLTALFDRTEAVFDSGNAALARQAYEKLFAALALEDDYGRGVRPYDLPDVDMQEARARYLREVYETEPPKRRPEALFECFGRFQFWDFPSSPQLEDLLEISTRPLPDRDRFLEDWIAYLKQCDDRKADRWLREAVRLARGTQGLEELARTEGRKHPRAYLDWFAALEQESRYCEVLEAAQEALQELPANLPIRAAIADHLCKAAAELSEPSIFQAGRWEAFLVKPTAARLVALWEAIPEVMERLDRMRGAVRHVEDYLEHPPTRSTLWDFGSDDLEHPAWVDKSALAHAYLLSGEWEAAHRLAAAEKPLGWSSSNNPQGLAVAFFLMALSGKVPGALPANLGRLWREALGCSAGFGSLGFDELSETMGAQGRETTLVEHLNAAYRELLLNAPLSEEQQKNYLTWCLEVITKRVNGIVGGQHRRSYGKAAALAGAGIEVLRLRGDEQAAQALLDEVRGRFPRHRAFQGELNAAIKAI
jgi:hypothetical protein